MLYFSYFSFPRNILALMNALNLPEGNITDVNYEDMLQSFNSTFPETIQGLNLKTCDLNTFLSDVCFSTLY